MKKPLKVVLIILGVILLLLVSGGIIFRNIFLNLLINNSLEGPQGEGPGAAAGFLKIEKGPADWTSWRGPEDDGKSAVTGIRTQWEGGLKKVWEIDWLCQGRDSVAWSSPVIQGNHLIIEGRDEDEDITFCLNARTGELVWEKRFKSDPGTNHGTGARATPTIDENRVFSLNRQGDLLCRDLKDGRLIWQANLTDVGGEIPLFGFSASPLVYKDLVIADAGGEAGTAAFDKMSGMLKWKCPTSPVHFVSVTKAVINGRDLILSFHEKGLSGINPETGVQEWFTPFGSKAEKVTTPTVWGDNIFITGILHGCQLISVNGRDVNVLWKNGSIQSHHSDPVVIGNYLYGYSGESSQNRGSFKCLDLATGETAWETKEVGWGTTVFVDGYLICMDIKGNLFLVKPDPEKFIKAGEMAEVFGKIRGPVWTVPVAANGFLYVRFKQQLVCLDLKA